MTRTLLRAVLIAALLAAGCAVRPPVVTSPVYPDYLYPAVPAELRGSPAARRLDDAWAFFQAGDLANAERRYVALVETSPGFFPAETGLGWLRLARGDARAAELHFGRAVTASTDYVPALVGRGEALLALDDAEAALRSFEAALALDAGLAQIGRTVEQLRFTLVSRRLAAAREDAAAGRLPAARAAYAQLIAASPGSAFLHLELGRVERDLGDAAAALGHVQRAIELDLNEPAAFRLEGELHAAAGDLEAAVAAFERVDRLAPDGEVTRQLDQWREQLRLAALPPEIRAIPEQATVTRGELAALIGSRFADLLAVSASGGRTVIVTDTREHWAQAWILEVTRAGVMDVDAAYRFDPARTVRRADLAEIASALLDLLAAGDARAAARRASGGPAFSDMPAAHLGYPSAARAVTAGVMRMLDGQAFRPTLAVDGATAARVMDRLAALADEAE